MDLESFLVILSVNLFLQILRLQSIMFSTSKSECIVIEPPNKISRFMYKCDKVFYLDHIIDLSRRYEYYGVALLSGKRSDFYLYSQNSLKLIRSIKSDLPSQHKTGGSSAPRMGRIRDERINAHIRRLAEYMVQFYCLDGIFNYNGLYIGGPAEIKDKVQYEDIFMRHLSKNLIDTFTLSEITDGSIHILIEKINMRFSSSAPSTDNIFTEFEEMINNPKELDKLIFGTEEVFNAIDNGICSTIYTTSNQIILIDEIDALVSENKIKSIRKKIIQDESLSKNFIAKYGVLVGIKYFASEDNLSIESESDLN